MDHMTISHSTKNPNTSQRPTSQPSGDLVKMIATILDSAFTIPGTNIRIGLDPLLGLIPGIGDYLTNLIGTSLLIIAIRSGVPLIVIFRMSCNIFLNMAIGAIPGIGDLFSFWFKSNVRNAELFQRYSQFPPPASTALDWVYVVTLMTSIVIALTGLLFGITWLVKQIWQLVA